MEADSAEEEAEEAGYKIKNKNPTQRCGEQNPGLTIELYKYLDEDNLRLLARILNQIWIEKSYPDNFTLTKTISIY